ncbi:MAG: T9SS type A sorting domain-containing protein [bacterium]
MNERSTIALLALTFCLFSPSLYGQGSGPLISFKLSGNTNERIKAGEVISLKLKATAEGPGTLSLKIAPEQRLSFVSARGDTAWQDTTIVCGEPCELKRTLIIRPDARDCGSHAFIVEAEFLTPDAATFSKTQGVTVSIFPRINPEPPFTRSDENDVCWVGCAAHDQFLHVSPDDGDELNPAAPFFAAASQAICDGRSGLNNGVRYKYVVETIATGSEGETVKFFSDPEFSTQDDLRPEPAAVHDFFTDPESNVTLRWFNVQDRIGFVDKYVVTRREEGTANVDTVAVLPFFPVTDITPLNYFPEVAQENSSIYADTTIKLLGLPRILRGTVLLKTAMRDRWNESGSFLQFTLATRCSLFVAYDRLSTPPDWLDDFEQTKFRLATESHPNKGRLKIHAGVREAGKDTLGGNFAPGSVLKRSTVMYAVFIQPLDQVLPYATDGLVRFTDPLSKNENLGRSKFRYRVDTFDAAGNRATGRESSLIIVDPKAECRPDSLTWFVYERESDGEKFGRGIENQVCIMDPTENDTCNDFRGTDSLRFQAVRDSLKFFDDHKPGDEDVRFFDTGWLGVDQLQPPFCHTFELLPDGFPLDFVDGARYYYRVQAKDFHGNVSAWSDTVSAIQDTLAPGAVGNLQCRASVPDCKHAIMTLSWEKAKDHGGTGVEVYQIWRRTAEEASFTLIDSVAGSDTTFSDTLRGFDESTVVFYKVRARDFLGHKKEIADLEVVSKRAPISPQLALQTEQAQFCVPGLSAIDADTATFRLDGDSTGVRKYIFTVEGPKIDGQPCSGLEEFTNTALDLYPVPLTCGDGLYTITLRAEYDNIVSTCSDTTVLKQTSAPQPPDSLIARHDTLPTGNILLWWTHPTPDIIREYQIFRWPQGQTMPDTPSATVDTTHWVFDFERDNLVAYECNNIMVKAVDCFGRPSENNPVVLQYSNRPPGFDTTRFDTGSTNITVCWTRPSPRIEEADNFNAIVKIYQDSITAEPFLLDSVFNQLCLKEVPLESMHVYIFFVKEVITDDLGKCGGNSRVMSAWSRPVSVPLDNPVVTVEFDSQALPVPPDASTGCVFLSWPDYGGKRVDSFRVEWAAESDSGARILPREADTVRVCGLDTSKIYQITVVAHDTLGQSSTPIFHEVSFKPPWLFTPKVMDFGPTCFRDRVTLRYCWLDADTCDIADTFGADSVQVQISVDSTFAFEPFDTTFTVGVFPEFKKSQHYDAANLHNNKLFARLRGIDGFGHRSPWSTAYKELRTTPGNYDERKPTAVGCEIDSIITPLNANGNGVDVHLSWPASGDACGISHYQLIIAQQDTAGETTVRDTIIVVDTAHVDVGVPASAVQSRSWKVQPVDNTNNVQDEMNDRCGFANVILPPGVSVIDTAARTICWSKSDHSFDDEEVRYVVEVTNDPVFWGAARPLSERSSTTPDTCYTIEGSFDVSRLFWRIKARILTFESAWSDTFRTQAQDPATSVDANATELLPEKFGLSQNYPNPFNPTTTVQYAIPRSKVNGIHVRIDIFNIRGQKIRTLVNELKQPGRYAVVWDGRSDAGTLSGSGLYYYRLQTEEFVATRKLVFLK